MPVDSVIPSTTSPTPPSDTVKSRSDAMNQADFLQMLTAQLRAQDPMNPMDGQDFASQLAQFSSLQELQKQTKTADESLQTDLLLAQTFSNTMAATLIGKTVRADTDLVTVGKTGDQSMAYTLEGAAVDIKVEVRDSDGALVRTLSVGSAQAAGEHQISWDCKSDNGTRVPEGDYTFKVIAKDTAGADVVANPFVEGRVSELRYVEGAPMLIVNGITVQLGMVTVIRDSNNDGGA
jgi:flagellar basal-body rod modification protein FlgD